MLVSLATLYLQSARFQQELAQTQDRLGNSERGRQSAERQIKDLEVKLEELEAQGGKALKNQIKKLEQRVSQLYFNIFKKESATSSSTKWTKSSNNTKCRKQIWKLWNDTSDEILPVVAH